MLRDQIGLTGLVLALLLVGCKSAAYRSGAADAEADIAAGRPRTTSIGLWNPWDCAVHPDTGLPIKNLGCVLSPETLDYSGGYNTTIKRALDSGALPRPRLRVKLLSKRAVLDHFKTGEVLDLAVAGPGITVSAGARLRIVGSEDGQAGTLAIFPEGANEGRGVHGYMGKSRVVLLHEDTTALVHFIDLRRYFIIDLVEPIVVNSFAE